VSLTLCDVGPRDGLQNEPEVVEPAVRAELVTRLAAAGLPRIEAVSFVRAELVPQMDGAEQVASAIERREGTEYSGLVLNERGYERLLAARLDRVNCTLAPTDSFNRRNGNMTIEEASERVRAIVEASALPTTVTISCAWGCPFEGRVDPERVVELARELAKADELVLADTIGVAAPGKVGELVAKVAALGTGATGAHFHNTRNTGYANAYAALEAGASVLDASIGGLGGCPFAPRATGNIATDDLVYMLEEDGIETGVDLDALIRVSEWLEGLLGRVLPGQVYRAGPFPSGSRTRRTIA
jgi:hydroxymethylglutaryl-CoA lyase/(R)-citramalyl-CoA lyase